MKLNEHPKCEEIKAELDSGTPHATVAQRHAMPATTAGQLTETVAGLG